MELVLMGLVLAILVIIIMDRGRKVLEPDLDVIDNNIVDELCPVKFNLSRIEFYLGLINDFDDGHNSVYEIIPKLSNGVRWYGVFRGDDIIDYLETKGEAEILINNLNQQHKDKTIAQWHREIEKRKKEIKEIESE